MLDPIVLVAALIIGLTNSDWRKAICYAAAVGLFVGLIDAACEAALPARMPPEAVAIGCAGLLLALILDALIVFGLKKFYQAALKRVG